MNAPSTAADLILHNGLVTTVDRSNPSATAVAILDGKFLRVSTEADVMPLAGAATRVIDLKGRRVLPGLIAEITAELTVVGGNVVYGAGQFTHLDEVPPPPAMPDWSPVRRFGGYAAWAADRERPATRAVIRQAVSACGRAHVGGVHSFTSFWGALGCACWAF